MTPVKKVCVITGGTSGIGLCTAQAMLEKGYTVYELSRRAEGAPGMKHIMADVTKEETLAMMCFMPGAPSARLDSS